MALIRQRTGFFANHPVLTATTAASSGVLLGAYVAMQIFAAPVPNEAKVPAAAPVADAKPPVKQVEKAAETTGSAPAAENVGTADPCEGQAWPYLTRECTEQMQKHRPPRVVTTDRVQTPAPEPPAASRKESVAAMPAPGTSAAPAPTAAPNAAAPAVSAAPGAVFPAPATKPAEPAAPKPAVAAAPPASSPAAEPAPKAQAGVAVSAPANPQDAAAANEPAPASKSAERSAEQRKIKQAKQRAKKQQRNRDIVNEDDDGPTLASAERGRMVRGRDDRGREVRDHDDDERTERVDRADRRSQRAESRSDRARRERFATSRDDDDAVSERRGRRVIVIERDGGGGLFGGLFGRGTFGN